ncbi:hypothetical protein BH23CHL10_BH23CHL10_07760 [soil metagenome]
MMRLSYDMWPQYNRRLREAHRGPDRRKAGHPPIGRWFPAGSDMGWEDDLDHPRNRGHGPNVGHRAAVRLAA